MKNILKLILVVLVLAFPNVALAASPQLSIRPGSGKVVNDKNFTVDILIDSKGNSVGYARASIKFDPELLQVVRAQRNASLFCSYPEDEQSIDNTNGSLMITGFCQSGVGKPYKTSGGADVLARVTFRALDTGTATISWEYSGEDEPFKSVVLKDGSPPTNIMSEKPKNAVFTIVSGVSNTPTPPRTPNTGMALSIGMVLSGVALVSLGFAYAKWSEKRQRNKLKTVVMYGNKK